MGTSPFRRYAVALVITLVAVLSRWVVEPVLQGNAPLLMLLAAPILSALLGGAGPGLLSTALCAVAGLWVFILPQYPSLPPSEWFRLAIFTLYGGLFSLLIAHNVQRRRELVQAQGALSERERRATEALEASPAGMLLVEPDGTISLANAQAARMFGHGPAELVGLSVDALVPPGTYQHHAALRAGFAAAPSQRPMGAGRDLLARRKDGSVFPVEVGLNPVPGRGAGRVLASVLDITERQRAEQALRDSDRRKDEFIALLAHELRNPLGPIRSAVEILRRALPDDPKVRRPREIIERQVSHMTRLIDDLLDVSRIARGKLDLQTMRCDLHAIVRQTAEDYRASLERRGLQLVVRGAGRPGWVEGDPVRLSQILANLLSNSEKFTPEGGTVEVLLPDDRVSGSHVVEVVDTGMGIRPDFLPWVFEPFSQQAQDLARSQGGLGMGLALSRGLARLHGGDLVAHSAGPGQGARFVLSLPARSGPADVGTDSPAAQAGTCRLRVLVIEDNTDAAVALSQLLEMAGHEVQVRFDGVSGLEAALALRPQAVISDLGLPGACDGYCVASALREDPRTRALPLIALSGYADAVARDKAARAGFDLHLAKPADPAALERALHRLTAGGGP